MPQQIMRKGFSIFKICTFAFVLKLTGEMSEWLKEHAWKACVRQKCTEGSNPSLSAF